MSTIEGVLRLELNKRYRVHCYPRGKEIVGPQIELASGDNAEICRPDEVYLTGHIEHNLKDYGGYYFSPNDKHIAPFALQDGYEARVLHI